AVLEVLIDAAPGILVDLAPLGTAGSGRRGVGLDAGGGGFRLGVTVVVVAARSGDQREHDEEREPTACPDFHCIPLGAGLVHATVLSCFCTHLFTTTGRVPSAPDRWIARSSVPR